VVRPDGKQLDYVREAAEEAGYLRPGSDINDLKDAMVRDASGPGVYPRGDQPYPAYGMEDLGPTAEAMERSITAWNDARRFTRGMHQVFSEGQAQRVGKIGSKVEGSQAAGALTRTKEDLQRYIAGAQFEGRDPTSAIGAMENWLLRDFEQHNINYDGTLKSAKGVRDWLAQKGHLLNEVNPSLRDKLADVASLRDGADEVILRNDAAEKEQQRTAAASFLNEEPEKAVWNIVKGPNAEKRAIELMRSLPSDAAREGVRSALSRRLMYESAGTALDLNGKQVVRGSDLHDLILKYDRPISAIFRPDQRNMLETIRDAAVFNDKVETQRQAGSGTFGLLLGDRYLDALISNNVGRLVQTIGRAGGTIGASAGAGIGGLLGGTTGGVVGAAVLGALGREMGPRVLERLYSGPRQKVIDLLAKAVDNPELGVQLQKKANVGSAKFAGPTFRATMLGALGQGALAARGVYRKDPLTVDITRYRDASGQ
jgi:hypothetical protein